MLPGPPTLYQSILDHPDRAGHDLSTPARGGDRSRRHPGRADPPHRRRAAVLHRHHRLRAHRGRNGRGHLSGDDVETVATTVGRPRPGFELRIVDDEAAMSPPASRARSCSAEGASCRTTSTIPRPRRRLVPRRLAANGRPRRGRRGRAAFGSSGGPRTCSSSGASTPIPAEIENPLLRHPDIQQAAVIGVPDERLGEVGMAFVVTRPDRRPPGAEIVEWCRDQMANYKVPRRVELVDELPAQRHREGHEGRPPRAGRAEPRRGRPREHRAGAGAVRSGRPAGRRAGRVGRRPGGGCTPGRLGSRRHQSRSAHR